MVGQLNISRSAALACRDFKLVKKTWFDPLLFQLAPICEGVGLRAGAVSDTDCLNVRRFGRGLNLEISPPGGQKPS